MNSTVYERRSEPAPASRSSSRPRSPTVSVVLCTVNQRLCRLVPVSGCTAGSAIQPRGLLALIVYYYAMGVLSSRDMERAWSRSAHLRLASSDEFPDWRQIRQFRRENREVVCQCLGEVLAATESGPGSRPAQACAAEAERRVAEAVLLDHVFADD